MTSKPVSEDQIRAAQPQEKTFTYQEIVEIAKAWMNDYHPAFSAQNNKETNQLRQIVIPGFLNHLEALVKRHQL